MTQPELPTGVPLNGKVVNLAQLETELTTAGVDVSQSLGLSVPDDIVFTYANGQPADFPSAQVPLVQTTITKHVAMRDKSDAEYAAEYADPRTNSPRKATINNIMTGLLPREQVAL